MFTTSFITTTLNSKIEINAKFNLTGTLIEYEDKELFRSLCEKGCQNYDRKWACPPHSPSFNSYSKNYKGTLVVCFYIYLDQFDYISNNYGKLRAANAILKSKMDKFMRKLENQLGGKYLSNGSCRLCKPCNCKINLRCKKPDKMRYSMESVGLNVSQISKNILDHHLLWYKKGDLPLYTSVVSCCLYNDQDISIAKVTELLTSMFG